MRCPRCLELLVEDKSSGVIINYCGNKECTVADGVYQDETDKLGYGKGVLMLHLPTYNKFMEEVEFRENRIKLLVHAKDKAVKDATYWQDKYYNTFDFKVLQKIREIFKKEEHKYY